MSDNYEDPVHLYVGIGRAAKSVKHDRRAALVEEMCRAVANAWDTEQRMQDGMSAALDLALEEAAKECELMATDFLSDEYAAQQPLSSITERFACKQCAAAIRALKGKQ